MQSLRIAFRNIIRQRKRSMLLGGAIAFGFFIFSLIGGFTRGLTQTIEGNFSDLLGGHLYITGSEVSERGSEISLIHDTQTIEEALTVIDELVATSNLRSTAGGSLIFGSRQENQRLVGIDVAHEQALLEGLTFIEGNAETFAAEPRGIILPAETLEDLRSEVGEVIIIRSTTVNGQQNVSDFVISGSLAAQQGFSSGSAYLHLGTLNTLLDMQPEEFQSFNITLHDIRDLPQATDLLYKELLFSAETTSRYEEAETGPRRFFGGGGLSQVDEAEQWQGTKFELTTLNDFTDQVMSLVKIMDQIGLGIFVVILLIIMVGMMNSYRMVMLERIAEIGTMRAMGVQKGGIRMIFIAEAFFIALGGALVGFILALIFMSLASLYPFGTTGGLSFFLDQGHMRFSPTPSQTISNLILLCLMSIMSVSLPARAAANLKPAEALRASH